MSGISLWRLFRVWFSLGAQSWGGGSATLMLIRRAVVEEECWVDGDEFARLWAVCQIAPGINLLGLTTLIGHRLAGWRGIGLALLGLLLPSVVITALITAGYAVLREQPLMQRALQGVVPATIGLGVMLSWQLAVPLWRRARSTGKPDQIFLVLMIAAAALVMITFRPPVITLLLGGGAVGALWGILRARRPA
jgi:chromate transporter